jgi:hypothetical protein
MALGLTQPPAEMNGPLLHEFRHQHSFPIQKTLVISFLAGKQRLFKLFLVCLVLCVHPLL